jgi:predicted Ser/Thr protein kinase
MPDERQIFDLVVRWEEMRAAGRSLSAEDLCQDCPELLPAVRLRLEAMRALDAGHDRGEETTTAWGSGAPSKTVGNVAPASPADVYSIPGYEVLRELGRGGMGVVYLARQARLGRLVALKMLLAHRHAAPAHQARFQAEVEAIGRLRHPNLVQVYEVGEHDGRAFFSMEYLDGGSLEEKIAARPQPPREAALLVELLARAIHTAHQHSIIHRDLKPANVMLTADGCPKISDFGLAKRLDVSSGPTHTQHVLGTPSYMAPEQASGRSREVGPGTDVYSLGAILYQMLTGRPPFQGESAMDVARQVLEFDPVAPRRLQASVPVELETICLKCLQKHPAQRYQSAADLADDLRRYCAGEPIAARPISSLGRLAKWARRRPAAAGLVAVICLTGCAALAAGSWFTHRLSTELQTTERAKRDLNRALARQVAEGLSGDLRQLEMVPQSMAALLARQVAWKEGVLEDWTRSLVLKDKRVFALCVAFEPGQFRAARAYDDYCLYVHEHGDGVLTKQLLPPDYPPPFSYRQSAWYTAPKAAKRSVWVEPYIGQGANNTPMVSYSVPFSRNEQFSGVVSADLSMAYFRGLHNQLQSLYLGPDSYSFVITPKGTFVYHPNPLYEFPAAKSSLDRIDAAPDFLALAVRMGHEESGLGRATDFNTGRSAAFLFARIPSTGWQFVVVHHDPASGE